MTDRSPTDVLPNLIIRASAGTGKTFQLSNRFIGLLRRGVPADRILATTFTRKAAGEILDRVVVRLAEAVFQDAQREQLARFIGEPLTKDTCLRLLRQLLEGLYRLRISTLDSFYIQVARSLALELGLPPDWRIVDEHQDTAFREQALEALFQQDQAADLLTLTHLLTKGEADRSVGELIRSTVNSLHDLYLETDEPAWQKVPRHKPLDGPALVEVLDQLRSVEITDKSLNKARHEDHTRAADQDWSTFISKGLAAKIADGSNRYSRKPIPDALLDIYRPLVEHARSVLVGRLAMQTEASYALLRAFDAQYQGVKQQRRGLRFTDVTQALADEARRQQSGGEIERLAFRLDGRIEHVLLDEFQDTSPAQWHAIRPLADSVCSADRDRSFFCVGDVKQAIYGWRGGVAEIFDAIGKQLTDLEQASLNKSFRSSQPVIDTVNAIFGGINRHSHLHRTEAAVKRWVERFEAHETERKDLPGYACLVTAATPAEGQSRADRVLECAVDHVVQLTKQVPGCSLGVLVRRNDTVAKLIGLLRGRSIPASEEGGSPLTDSAAVQVLLSLCRLSDHPGDLVARFHVYSSPLATHLAFADFCDDESAGRLAQVVRRSLLERGYGQSLASWATPLYPCCSSRERNRVEQLIELAYTYQARASLRVDDFVRQVQTQKVADPLTTQVRVMTIHQAKGLEFDIVVLPELDAKLVGQPGSFVVHRPDPSAAVDRVCRYANESVQRLLPKSIQQLFADTTARTVTESLCVLYVAVTRAVHSLHMIIEPSPANERTMPNSFAGLLRAALHGTEPVPADRTLFETGDRAWHTHLPHKPPAAAAELPAEASRPAGLIKLASATARRRGLERTSPSALEGGARVRVGQLLLHDQRESLVRGSIIHAWFEQIAWLDEGPPAAGALREIAAAHLRNSNAAVELSMDTMLEDFFAMLARPEVDRVLRRSGYQPPAGLGLDSAVAQQLSTRPLRLHVANERAFAVRDKDRLLTGEIDRLVLLLDGARPLAADVLDFKTDAVAADRPEQLAERVNYYRPQLEAYRRAVALMTGLDAGRIAARLLFVGPGLLYPV